MYSTFSLFCALFTLKKPGFHGINHGQHEILMMKRFPITYLEKNLPDNISAESYFEFTK